MMDMDVSMAIDTEKYDGYGCGYGCQWMSIWPEVPRSMMVMDGHMAKFHIDSFEVWRHGHGYGRHPYGLRYREPYGLRDRENPIVSRQEGNRHPGFRKGERGEPNRNPSLTLSGKMFKIDPKSETLLALFAVQWYSQLSWTTPKDAYG